MKKITFGGLMVFLIMSGVILAQQPEQQKKDSPMQGVMQEMMKGEQSGEGSMEGMSGMGGMMRMMKVMMNQCSAMMEHCCPMAKPGKTDEGQDK